MIARFGAYEVDFDKVEIRHDGRPVPVQPQVFSVIEFLITERERVVTKEEVLDTVWGDRFVSESALTSRIKSARRALGDSGAEQAVIRTVVGRGYRFVANLEATASEPAVSDPSSAATASPRAVDAVAETPMERGIAASEWPLVGRRTEQDLVVQMFHDRTAPGVVVTGPEHIGVSRFVDECRHGAERIGHQTARVVGLASASTIPFGAISHLLSPEILAAEHSNGELALAETLARAQRLIEESTYEKRLLISVENAHHLDPLTSTLLSTLALSGSAFVVAHRTPLLAPSSTPGAEDPGASSLLHELPLSRLDETTVDILLHRVLGGPIGPAALRQIVDMSDGRPGLVRDVVEESISSETLVCDHGVWRVTGQLSSTARRVWDRSAFPAAAVHGAEVLALLKRLPEDDATETIGEAGLEELDAHHLIAIERIDGCYWFSLVDPLLAMAVRDGITPLRERRLKDELAAALLLPSSSPATIATIASWTDTSAVVDDALLLAAAQTAMIGGDMATAGLIVEHIVDTDDAAVQLIEAEVALRHSQWARAESLFDAITVDDLDEMSASHVLRRQAAIQFYSRARYDETIAWLETEADRRGGRAARALRARRVGMLAYLGRADDTLNAASQLGDMHGLTAIEVNLSTGSAYFHQGSFESTLTTIDRVDELIAELPEAWADEARDGAVTVRCSGLLHVGRLDEAAELARRSLPIGKRTALGYFPSLAAMIEIAAGRPKAAREMVRPAVHSSHREAFPQYLSIAEGVYALTDLALGNRDSAATGLDHARHAIALLSGELRWLLSMMIAELSAGLGRPDPAAGLLQLADEAASVGATMRQADLLWTAAMVEPTGPIPDAVVDQVEDLVAGFDGLYWPLRSQHLRALVDGQDLVPVLAAYRALGFVGGLGFSPTMISRTRP